MKFLDKSSFEKKPLISIITTVRNGEKSIEKTIKSVINQSYKNIEYIIIDGDSKDNTNKIIRKYKKKIKYLVSKKDKGIYDGFNKGYKIAKGDFIGIINSDDVYKKKAIETVVSYINKNKDIDFIFGSVKKHYGLLYGYNAKKIQWSWNFYPAHSVGFFIKRKSANKIGKYNLKYKYCSDYDFLYRMVVKQKMHGVCTKKSEVLGNFAPNGFSTTINLFDLFLEEIKIRIDNNQNILMIAVFVLNKIVNNPLILLRELKKKIQS